MSTTTRTQTEVVTEDFIARGFDAAPAPRNESDIWAVSFPDREQAMSAVRTVANAFTDEDAGWPSIRITVNGFGRIIVAVAVNQ